MKPLTQRDKHFPQLRDDLVWANFLTPAANENEPAVFFDRDGVLIEDRNYLSSPNDVTLINGAAESIKRASERGYVTVIVTNQSGIARGLFQWCDHKAVEDRMLTLLTAQGARVNLILACGHHPEGFPPYGTDHPWRKPNPGMILEAKKLLKLDVRRSVLVGDKVSDIAAARAAGLERAFLTLTGQGRKEAAEAVCLQSSDFFVSVIPSVNDFLR